MVAVDVDRPPLYDEAVGLTTREYQTEGIKFLYGSERAMITDAPGLGKTPQAALAAVPPAIVVAPTYLVQQWGDWLKEHLPKRSVVVATGTRQEKIDAMLKPADFLIVNKEMLRTHIKELLVIARRYHVKTLIFDESHHLRNRGTSASKGAVDLAKLVDRAYLLTATPIWKEVDDLFMQLRILHPDIFTSYNDFVETWCLADQTRFGTRVLGAKKEMLPELNKMMDVIRIGRTYEQAGRELPPVIENNVRLDFADEKSKRRYQNAVDNFRLQFEDNPTIVMTSYIEVMHTLRQLTAAEKLGAIQEQIEDSEPYHNGRYVIFTWYKDFAYSIHNNLPGSVLITGDEPPEERRKLAMQRKPIVATLGALSEGVDLSWARMVMFAEEHWTPGSQVQSLARVRRERQTESNDEPILVYYMSVKDTIDETIHQSTRRRSATIKEVMNEALGIYL